MLYCVHICLWFFDHVIDLFTYNKKTIDKGVTIRLRYVNIWCYKNWFFFFFDLSVIPELFFFLYFYNIISLFHTNVMYLDHISPLSSLILCVFPPNPYLPNMPLTFHVFISCVYDSLHIFKELNEHVVDYLLEQGQCTNGYTTEE